MLLVLRLADPVLQDPADPASEALARSSSAELLMVRDRA